MNQPSRCTLLGGTFSMLVQVGLMISAIATLVYKRATERPRRPWVVWFFDASKQAFAGVLQHFVNLIFGIVFARSGRASECAWYLVNFTISVACGVVILWGTMRLYTYTVDRFDLTILRSGEYGSPPSWRPWMAQMLIWGVFASGEKLITAVAVIVPLHPRLDEFAARLETPVVDAPFTELLLVMVVAPVILNMLFFWVIDSIIMRKRPGDSHHYPEGSNEDDRPIGDKRPLLEESCGCCPPFTSGPSYQCTSPSPTMAAVARPSGGSRSRCDFPG